MGELDGKVAIVTGAGRLRGIGRAAAVELARLGADVVVTGTGRNPDSFPPDEKAIGWRDVESVADQIREHGRKALTSIVDVTNFLNVQNLVDQTISAFGRVDILINNAAINPRPKNNSNLLENYNIKYWDREISVGLTGAFICSKILGNYISK